MKKFNVECRSSIYGVKDNFVGDYIEAETEDEAIDLAIDYLSEQVSQNFTVIDIDRSDELAVTYVNDDRQEVTERYFDFEATEVEG
jgi:hypothetical protein